MKRYILLTALCLIGSCVLGQTNSNKTTSGTNSQEFAEGPQLKAFSVTKKDSTTPIPNVHGAPELKRTSVVHHQNISNSQGNTMPASTQPKLAKSAVGKKPER